MSLDDVWNEYDSILTAKRDEEAKKQIKRCYCDNFDTNMIQEDISEAVTVCIQCGYIFSFQFIDDRSDWNDFDDVANNKSRCGYSSSPLFPNCGLSTKIGNGSYQFKNKNSGLSTSTTRLQQIHNWNTMPYEEKVLWQLMERLKVITAQEGISNSVIKETVYIFREITAKDTVNGKKEIHRGKVREGLIAASLYHAIKHHQIECTPAEVSKLMGISSTDMSRCCKLFSDIMNNKKIEQLRANENEIEFYKKLSHPSELALRFMAKLGFPWKISSLCEKIVYEIVDRMTFLAGTSPQSIAAGSMYFVVSELKLKDITKDIIASTAGVSPVTVSKVYREICDHKQQIFSAIKESKK